MKMNMYISYPLVSLLLILHLIGSNNILAGDSTPNQYKLAEAPPSRSTYLETKAMMAPPSSSTSSISSSSSTNSTSSISSTSPSLSTKDCLIETLALVMHVVSNCLMATCNDLTSNVQPSPFVPIPPVVPVALMATPFISSSLYMGANEIKKIKTDETPSEYIRNRSITKTDCYLQDSRNRVIKAATVSLLSKAINTAGVTFGCLEPHNIPENNVISGMLAAIGVEAAQRVGNKILNNKKEDLSKKNN